MRCKQKTQKKKRKDLLCVKKQKNIQVYLFEII